MQFPCAKDWNDLLNESIKNSKYIGTDQNDTFVFLDKNNTKEHQKKLSLIDIVTISSRFQNEKSEELLLIAASLKKIATASEAKHYAGVGKIKKVFFIVINGLMKRGFETTETKMNTLAEKILKNSEKEGSSLAQKSQSSTSIITYKKGEIKTRSIIPTVKEIDGGLLGKGKYGAVYAHRNNNTLAVKKSRTNLTKEYEFARNLKHRCIASTKQLFIKLYSDGNKKFKLVIEKLEGKPLTYYYRQENNSKLPNEVVRELLLDAKDTVRYLFNNKIVWADVNDENIFSTPDGHLKLCDFGFWGKEEDSIIRTKKLLLGAMELVGWIIKSSNIRLQGKDELREKAVIRPSEFFKVPCDVPIIYTAHAILGQTHLTYFNTQWMQALSKELETMPEEVRITLVERYLDCVIHNFSK